MLARTQATSSPVSLEALLPLLPQTLNTPAMPEGSNLKKTVMSMKSKRRPVLENINVSAVSITKVFYALKAGIECQVRILLLFLLDFLIRYFHFGVY